MRLGRYDRFGRTLAYDVVDVDGRSIEEMTSPVLCLRCHRGIYDLGTVVVTARYTDCSVWRTPCCGLTVDSRGADGGWGIRADYERATSGDVGVVDELGEEDYRW